MIDFVKNSPCRVHVHYPNPRGGRVSRVVEFCERHSGIANHLVVEFCEWSSFANGYCSFTIVWSFIDSHTDSPKIEIDSSEELRSGMSCQDSLDCSSDLKMKNLLHKLIPFYSVAKVAIKLLILIRKFNTMITYSELVSERHRRASQK